MSEGKRIRYQQACTAPGEVLCEPSMISCPMRHDVGGQLCQRAGSGLIERQDRSRNKMFTCTCSTRQTCRKQAEILPLLAHNTWSARCVDGLCSLPKPSPVPFNSSSRHTLAVTSYPRQQLGCSGFISLCLQPACLTFPKTHTHQSQSEVKHAGK